MIIYPFNSEEFHYMWDCWKQYKLQKHKFEYKSELTEQMALRKLARYAKSNEQKAINILENAIASDKWQGFYPESENKSNGKGNTKDRLSIEQIDYIISNKDI